MNNLNSHIATLLKLWRNSNASNPLSKKEIAQVSQSLLNLQRGLTGERELAGAGYMQNNSYLGAYLLYYWPVTYMQIHFALSDFKFDFDKEKVLQILDLGSGPGPASVSLCDELKDYKKDVTLVDFSSNAINLAKKIYKKDFPSVNVEGFVCNFEKQFPELENKKYDLIVMSHALNELWKTDKDFIQKRTDFIKKISGYLSENGLLILSEPALLKTSRNLIQLRNELVQNDFQVAAPCVCSEQCPAFTAGENQTCHCEVKWNAPELVLSLAKNAGLDRESVKMTYFVFKKNTGKPEAEKISSDLTKENENTVYRVVSDGMLNKSGRVRFLLCDGKQRIAFSAKKDSSAAQSAGFFNLKRYDVLKLNKPELRGESQNPAFGMDENTEIKLVSKKLP